MSVRTTIAALALAGFGLAGGAAAAASGALAVSGALAAAAPPAAVLTTFGNPIPRPPADPPPAAVLTTFGNPIPRPSAVTLDDITGGSPQSQGIPIPR
jgi:hypothetical protein